MNFQARFFFGAVITALVIMVGSGLYATHLRTYDLPNAVAACENQSRAYPEPAPGQLRVVLICDPESLRNLYRPGEAVGTNVQGQVLKTDQRITLANTLGFTFGFWTILIGAVPAVWYFFLARCAELAAAFRSHR